jgi:IrrE N-terminal-like domain
MSIIGNGPQQGFCVSGKSAGQIDAVARQARLVFGLCDSPSFKPEQLLEKLTAYSITLDVVDDYGSDLPLGVEACWEPDKLTLTLRESVYIGACKKEPRALFTIAHEVGHLALGHRRTGGFHRATSTAFLVYEDSEWQANTFAGEFLMPLALIKKHAVDNAEKMMTVFGVSRPAAETRIKNLRKRKLIAG